MIKKITIIYEDSYIVAINKPAGIIVHPVNASDEQDSVTRWLVTKYPKAASVGDEPALRPGVVHRLDKLTSGILLLARTQRGYETLKEQFKKRTISKEYLALVDGLMIEDEGVIDKNIVRSKKVAFKMHVTTPRSGDGRTAQTLYKVIERFEFKKGEGATYLSAFPRTGRTHQIRVHLQSLTRPIVGDHKYGHKNMNHYGLERPFLHARALEFVTTEGKQLRLEADLPEELAVVLDKVRSRARAIQNY